MASYNYSSGTGVPTFTLPVQTVNGGLQSGPPPPAYQAPLVVGQSNKGSSFSKKTATWLSVVLIIAGVVGIGGAAMALRVFAYFSESGMGFWCGLIFIATGAVGIAAGHGTTIQLLKATVATASIAIAAAASQLMVAAMGLDTDITYYEGCTQFCYYLNYPPYQRVCFCDNELWERLAFAGNGLLIGSASLAFVSGIWLLVIASVSLRTYTRPQFQVAYVLPSQQTVTTIPQFQQSMVANHQVQPIILLSSQPQPTVSAPFVMHGLQQAPQPAYVFTQQPQESVTVNIQTQPTVSTDQKTGRPEKERIDM